MASSWINRKPYYLFFASTLYRFDKRLTPSANTAEKNYFCMRWGTR